MQHIEEQDDVALRIVIAAGPLPELRLAADQLPDLPGGGQHLRAALESDDPARPGSLELEREVAVEAPDVDDGWHPFDVFVAWTETGKADLDADDRARLQHKYYIVEGGGDEAA